MRGTLKKDKKKDASQKSTNLMVGSLSKTVEEMYSKPKKFSQTVTKPSETAERPKLVIHTKKTLSLVRREKGDDESSYMSVRVGGAGPGCRPQCPRPARLRQYAGSRHKMLVPIHSVWWENGWVDVTVNSFFN